jgi:hypothetical protein
VRAGSFLPSSSILSAEPNYNHTDAGVINFSGAFNENAGTINFKISNATTMGNIFNYAFSPISRFAQKTQWKTVIDNVIDFVQPEKVISKEHIKR